MLSHHMLDGQCVGLPIVREEEEGGGEEEEETHQEHQLGREWQEQEQEQEKEQEYK